jgi:hypothetical protein
MKLKHLNQGRILLAEVVQPFNHLKRAMITAKVFLARQSLVQWMKPQLLHLQPLTVLSLAMHMGRIKKNMMR